MTVTNSPASIPATWANPDPYARTAQPGAQGPTPDSVEIALDVLDRIVDDLFAVGLALHAGARNDDEERHNNTEAVLEKLDRIMARIRESVLRSPRPGGARLSVGITVDTTRQPHPPDLVALSSLANGELSSVDLLDAAHSATRALIALEDSTGPQPRPPAEVAHTRPPIAASRHPASLTHTGHMTLAEVAASGAQ